MTDTDKPLPTRAEVEYNPGEGWRAVPDARRLAAGYLYLADLLAEATRGFCECREGHVCWRCRSSAALREIDGAAGPEAEDR